MFIDINNDNVVDWQGWAYNVWNITNSEAAVYTFQLDGERTLLKFWSKFNFLGDREGSEGGEAQFEGRVVVMQVNGDVGLGDDDDDGPGVGDDSDEGLDSTLACIRQRRHNQILPN